MCKEIIYSLGSEDILEKFIKYWGSVKEGDICLVGER